MSAKYSMAFDMIWDDFESKGRLEGQKVVWERLKGKAARAKITKDTFNSAHRDLKEGQIEGVETS